MIEKNDNNKYEDFSFSTLPPEIIWLIFGYVDLTNLAICSRVCSDWNVLSQPFWMEELGSFLDALKIMRGRLMDIDVSHALSCAKNKCCTSQILSQLHTQELKIERNERKVEIMEEKKFARKADQRRPAFIATGYSFGGFYGTIYQNSSDSSFIGNIKRTFNKLNYTKNIEEAEKEEEKIIRKLTRDF